MSGERNRPLRGAGRKCRRRDATRSLVTRHSSPSSSRRLRAKLLVARARRAGPRQDGATASSAAGAMPNGNVAIAHAVHLHRVVVVARQQLHRQQLHGTAPAGRTALSFRPMIGRRWPVAAPTNSTSSRRRVDARAAQVVALADGCRGRRGSSRTPPRRPRRTPAGSARRGRPSAITGEKLQQLREQVEKAVVAAEDDRRAEDRPREPRIAHDRFGLALGAEVGAGRGAGRRRARSCAAAAARRARGRPRPPCARARRAPPGSRGRRGRRAARRPG